MKTVITAAATAVVLSLGLASAHADCANKTSGISKDGSLAPLEQAGQADQNQQAAANQTGGSTTGTATGDQANAGNGVVKDGSTAPLGTSPSIATSPQDVQRQQEGQPTAAAQATGDASSC